MFKRRIFIILFSSLFLITTACGEEGQEANDNISSMSTDSSSEQYPHTQPVRIQEAKYKFVVQKTTNNQTQVQKNQQQQRLNQAGQPKAAPNKQTPAPQQAAPKQQQQAAPKQQPNVQQQQAPAANGVSQTEQRVVELTNQERRKQGLPDLKLDVNLSKVAREKSNDMQAKGYFSHTSPTYGSPFDMMRDFGITYQAAGENIAQGQRTPEEVVQAWMNSEGHRKNILSAEFTHIGVGHETTANHWTQMFIKK